MNPRDVLRFAALFFWAYSATAKDLPDERKCNDPNSTKASEVIQCLTNIQKAVEVDLNKTYQFSMTQYMPPKLRANLRKTQRLWISYRDAVCKRPELDLDGANVCIIKITKDRITDIERFYAILR